MRGLGKCWHGPLRLPCVGSGLRTAFSCRAAAGAAAAAGGGLRLPPRRPAAGFPLPLPLGAPVRFCALGGKSTAGTFLPACFHTLTAGRLLPALPHPVPARPPPFGPSRRESCRRPCKSIRTNGVASAAAGAALASAVPHAFSAITAASARPSSAVLVAATAVPQLHRCITNVECRPPPRTPRRAAHLASAALLAASAARRSWSHCIASDRPVTVSGCFGPAAAGRLLGALAAASRASCLCRCPAVPAAPCMPPALWTAASVSATADTRRGFGAAAGAGAAATNAAEVSSPAQPIAGRGMQVVRELEFSAVGAHRPASPPAACPAAGARHSAPRTTRLRGSGSTGCPATTAAASLYHSAALL